MKRFLLLTITICFFFTAGAFEKRDLLQKTADVAKLKSVLIPDQKWVSYPSYYDRGGWERLTALTKDELIKKGEQALNYEWKVVKATDYLEYERSGSRTIMEGPYGANNTALSNLVLAELAEGKGRFIDQIINGVWLYCEMSTWVLSAHLPAGQATRRTLAEPEGHVIDLGSGDMGSFLAWTYHFFHKEFDRVNPSISKRLRNNLQVRILDPYMQRNDFWWFGFDYKPGMIINNWNPWCNFNVLSCFLLLENDPDKLAEAVYKTMVSTDQFLNYVKEDGACEEGPSYWGHAAGKLYDYLQLLDYATGGKVSLFDRPMVKNMGEYIARSYIGNGWVVNFADASAKGGGDKYLIFRYGKAVNSREMMQFASYLNDLSRKNTPVSAGRDLFRAFESLKIQPELNNTQPALSQNRSTYYPQTQFCYMRNASGFFFAAKGGFNNESHNHNDVGTFSFYVDSTPVFIDAGVGTYTRQTFSNERYSIWTMQSNYHNLPVINGCAQQFGDNFKAKDVRFDEARQVFSLDISGAYEKEASVKKWVRTYKLLKGGLTIEEDFSLNEIKSPNQVNFLTWGKPDITVAGQVKYNVNGKIVKMLYDKNMFTPNIETVTQNDSRLSNVWGPQVYRLSLNSNKNQLSGKYKFVIEL